MVLYFLLGAVASRNFAATAALYTYAPLTKNPPKEVSMSF